MKTLCATTAVYRANPEWLRDLAASMVTLADALPAGWRLVWAVQEDGDTPKCDWVEEVAPQASYGALMRRCGVAVTRNVALHRVPEADAVVNFDQDDVVAPDGVAASLNVLDANPSVGWVAGRVDDLQRDGIVTTHPSPLPVGPVEPGTLFSLWKPGTPPPVHTVGFVARSTLWRATGGWVAHPIMVDDTAAMMAVSSLWPGWVHHTPVALYRKHGEQNSSKGHVAAYWLLSHEMIAERVAALRKSLRPV